MQPVTIWIESRVVAFEPRCPNPLLDSLSTKRKVKQDNWRLIVGLISEELQIYIHIVYLQNDSLNFGTEFQCRNTISDQL